MIDEKLRYAIMMLTNLFASFYIFYSSNSDVFSHVYREFVAKQKSSHQEDLFYTSNLTTLYADYSYFPASEKFRLRNLVKEMFYHGYESYIKYAFPQDELNPLNCSGRGPDADRANININDVLGDYALTLVDATDTLAVLNNRSEFIENIRRISQEVSFDKDVNVQVFETTIRVLGALISAHIIATDPQYGVAPIEDYNNEMLDLSRELATRLMTAFTSSRSHMPYPRINLRRGVLLNDHLLRPRENCLAGVGTLLLEFGTLTSLTGDPTFENAARSALKTLWGMRDNNTHLFGNSIDVEDLYWKDVTSGIGAGMDSFYEYLLKSYIVFHDTDFLAMFNEAMYNINIYNRRGASSCFTNSDVPIIFRNVDMRDGKLINNWIDSLQASLPAVLVLSGNVEEAICQHALYFSIWQKYSSLPERFNLHLRLPDINFFPLRPELVESTFLLYMATKSPFYLHVGRIIAEDINKYARTECGFGTINDVRTKTLEDRMESFFLSETLKYLYLLFDEENIFNQRSSEFVFSTEGHIIPILKKKDMVSFFTNRPSLQANQAFVGINNLCDSVPFHFHHSMPLPPHMLYEIERFIGFR